MITSTGRAADGKILFCIGLSREDLGLITAKETITAAIPRDMYPSLPEIQVMIMRGYGEDQDPLTPVPHPCPGPTQ